MPGWETFRTAARAANVGVTGDDRKITKYNIFGDLTNPVERHLSHKIASAAYGLGVPTYPSPCACWVLLHLVTKWRPATT